MKGALFPDRGFPALVDVGRKIQQMHALGALLPFFDPNKRNLDFAGRVLSQKSFPTEMRKIVSADFLDRDQGAPVVLRHQQKRRIHLNWTPPKLAHMRREK
jgi:hypothetical protein